jgi:hypothetical protein
VPLAKFPKGRRKDCSPLLIRSHLPRKGVIGSTCAALRAGSRAAAIAALIRIRVVANGFPKVADTGPRYLWEASPADKSAAERRRSLEGRSPRSSGRYLGLSVAMATPGRTMLDGKAGHPAISYCKPMRRRGPEVKDYSSASRLDLTAVQAAERGSIRSKCPAPAISTSWASSPLFLAAVAYSRLIWMGTTSSLDPCRMRCGAPSGSNSAGDAAP